MKKLLINKLDEEKIISHNECKGTSGLKLDFYIDFKKALGKPDILNISTDLLYGLIDKRTTCVASNGLGGIPLATALSSRHGFYLTTVRDKQKKHGLNKLIESYYPKENDFVAIVDDVFTTGKSLKKIRDAISHTKAKIVGYYVILKRLENKPDFQLDYILTPDDLIEPC